MKFQKMLGISGTITVGRKIQYLRKLLSEEELRKFDTLCVQIGNTTSSHLKVNILGLGTYIFC